MSKGWLPVLEVVSLGDAGAVGPKNLNHLSPGSVWGRCDGEGRRCFFGELTWEGPQEREWS